MSVRAMKEEPSTSLRSRSAIRTCSMPSRRRSNGIASDGIVTRRLPNCASVRIAYAREREIMVLVTAGLMNKQVAGELGLSEITVKFTAVTL